MSPDGRPLPHRQRMVRVLPATAGVVLVAVAVFAVIAHVRLRDYERQRAQVLAHYRASYRGCIAQHRTPLSCQSAIYADCSDDPFWQRDPPFGSISMDDMISDASQMCQVWLD